MEDTKAITLAFSGCDEVIVPKPIEIKQSNRDYVSFGEDNDFPTELYNSYIDCSILQAIINGATDYTSGSGFETGEDNYINPKQKLSDLVKQCTLDYYIYGAFAVQVLRNDYGDIKKIYSLDPAKIRISEDEETIYYNDQFFKGYNVGRRTKVFPAFGDHKNSIFYYRRPTLRTLYGLPLWIGSFKSIRTLIELDQYHLSLIENQFTPSAVISFNEGKPSEEQQKKIETKINDKFSGSKNAGKLMVVFSDSKETSPELFKLDDDNYGEKFQNLYKTSRENVFISFRCTSQLFGLSPDITAFNSVEFEQSFKLFNKTVIEPVQREIERGFDALGYHFTLKAFNINFDEGKETEQ